uniref:DUF304 domain-containing protein n=1 Tax=Mycena chlorophos TaxID=658473 RepID=A0ABQ0L315_MYCCL|nr:predicted protein [Mycena chlorophos]
MNLAPLTPLLVGLTLTAITALGSRTRHQVIGDCQIFRFPAVIAYLMFAVALLFVGAPFLPGAAGDMDFLTFASFFWIIALLTVAFGAYLLKYRVTVDGDRVSVGVYFKREFSLHDIAGATVKKGGRSAELNITLSNGRKLTISGMLADFDRLAGLVTSHAAKSGAA